MSHSKKTNKQSSTKKTADSCMKNRQSFTNSTKDCNRSSYENCRKSQYKNSSDFESEYDNYFR